MDFQCARRLKTFQVNEESVNKHENEIFVVRTKNERLLLITIQDSPAARSELMKKNKLRTNR